MLQIKARNGNPGALNILSLLLKELLSSAIRRNPELENYIKNQKLRVGIKAGRMASTLIIEDGEVLIDNSIQPDVECIINGTLDGFLQLGIRKNPLPVIFRGKVKAKGNLFKLKPLIKIFGELRS